MQYQAKTRKYMKMLYQFLLELYYEQTTCITSVDLSSNKAEVERVVENTLKISYSTSCDLSFILAKYEIGLRSSFLFASLWV